MSSATQASLGNTPSQYGSVAKAFHWLTALLILTAIPLGLIANWLPYETSAQLALKSTLFSIHKTLGIAAFFSALGRILWALSQPKPGLLNAEKRLESFAAELVHWLLYGALVLVPLSGWLHHAASEGFAPIWWPFGQSLPFIPKNPELSAFFSEWHYLFTKLLAVSLALHIAGALKHHIIDKDATLRRMLPGRNDINIAPQPHAKTPIFAAALVWALAIALASGLALSHAPQAAAPEAELTHSEGGNWVVESGSLSIMVRQLGSDVSGSFAEWSADIRFDPELESEELGTVSVDIAINSLTLGTITGQAMEAEFFDAAQFPTARFQALIRRDGAAYIADGALTLKGATVPIALPFTLELSEDRARMAGSVTLDRRDFGIGTSKYNDEGSVAFPVIVTVELEASPRS